MRKRGPVFCSGCANLFYVGGATKPLCVATAKFIHGPLRQKIEVVGVKLAEGCNVANLCEYRASVSLQAWKLKRWLLGRLSDASEKRIKEVSLRDYPIKKENGYRKEYLAEKVRISEEDAEAEAEETRVSEEESSGKDIDAEEESSGEDPDLLDGLHEDFGEETGEEESLLSDGGTDDNDESSASGEIEQEDIQNT